MNLKHFLNCNKIKAKGIKDIAVIAEAIADCADLELSDDKKSVRRAGNKALPEKKGSMRKRESKASAKEEHKQSTIEKKEAAAEPETPAVVRDAQGRILFVPQDFENTLILNFVTKD